MKTTFTSDILSKIYKKDKIKRIVELCIGLLILSLSFNIFCRPNNLVSGGVSGVSIIIERVFGINPSLFILITNILLIVLSFLTLGKEKTIHTVIGAVLYPISIAMTESITNYIDVTSESLLLSTLFGGFLHGLGLGIVYKAGYTSGGTDILNQILSKYMKMSIGNAVYFTDGIIIILSGLVFGFNKVLYGLVLIYLTSYMTDKVIIGISSSKAFYIITKEPDKIKKYIIEGMHHSVTNLKAIGGFSNEKSTLLMTVLPTKEYYRFKQGILEIDSEAFFVVTDAYEVMGGE